MDTTAEDQRTLHEKRDRLEMAMVKEILGKKANLKEKLQSEHKQRSLLNKYADASQKLLNLYQAKFDNLAHSSDNCDSINKFYLSLKKITDLYEKHSDAPLSPVPNYDEETQTIKFTDEEGYGRYLDLIKSYEAYVQILKNESTKPDYLSFLRQLSNPFEISPDKKLSASYKNYLETIVSYCKDFCFRAKPLVNCEELEVEVEKKFTAKENGNVDESEYQIDLQYIRSREDLMGMGLDCLKQELQVRGLKCGGTLEQRADRLFSIKDKKPEEIPDNIKTSDKKVETKKRHRSLLEAKLAMYVDFYADHIKTTIENVQRKQARTAEEREEEDDDENEGVSDADDEDADESGEVAYNPKNLPLGWDGKPIPYWLYKLHGLNMEFNCEICGNEVYKGPKTFQRHFSEWKHAQSMRALGIPNSAHFANITKIEEAIALHQKLEAEKSKEKFNAEIEEECQDSQGNVINRKTYEDLKRQGLL